MASEYTQYNDSNLEKERRLKFRGTVRVRLEALTFQWNEPRELDAKNVDHLKSCFQKDGCYRLVPQNRVPAIIDEGGFTTAILTSGLSERDLLSQQAAGIPELVLPDGFQLRCLHGKHRIQAARETLLPGDRWWTIDLYIAGRV